MEYIEKSPGWQMIDESQFKNVKIYINRKSFIEQLPKHLDIMEIGVAAGDFSEFILDQSKPASFYLIDIFNHTDLTINNLPLRYTENTHLSFVENRFKNFSQVKILQGDSANILPNLNKYFDFIYIDADHSLEAIKLDIYNSIKLLKPDGIIGLNDFTKFDHSGNQYGTIEAVFSFLKDHIAWEICGFAFQDEGFFDIYIKRKIEGQKSN